MVRAFLAVLGVLVAAARVPAQESEGEPLPALRLEVPELVHLEGASDDASGKAFALLGPVAAEVEGVFSVRAARMVLWLDPDFDRTVFEVLEGGKVPLWAVRAVYAEGGRVPATFQTAGQVFRCSSLFYDFTTHEGLLVDVDLRIRRSAADGEPFPDLLGRAREVRARGPGEWIASDASFASTDYHDPEVVVEVERVTLVDAKMREALGRLVRLAAKRPGAGEAEVEAAVTEVGLAAASPQGKELRLEGIRARAAGVPFFRWGSLTLDEETLPLRLELDVGSRGDLGSGARLGIGLATKPVAWMAGFGYYPDRGPIFDVEIEVDPEERLSGRTFGVVLPDDRGTDRGVVPSTDDRYWVQNRYRYRIDDRWRIDGELTDLSDSTWLRTYDEGEFKEGKEQETLLQLRRRGSVAYHTLTGKVRTIGFQETLEELPRYVLSLPAATLFRFGRTGVVQASGGLEVANLRQREADGSAVPDARSGRLDADPLLYASFDWGPLRFVPFAEFRFTGYEQDLAGDSAGRYAGLAGLRIDTQLARRYGRTRHVVNLSLEYEDLYSVTEDAADLPQFDDVDALSPYELLGLRWRNRFQRRSPAGFREFLDFEVFGAWFPDGTQPLGATGDGFVELDLKWRPNDLTVIGLEAEVDADQWDLQTGALEGWWRARPRVFLFGGLRHLEGDSDVLTGSAEFEVDTRWVLTLSGQVELRAGDALDQEVRIERIGHTAVVRLKFGYDPGGEDFSFSVGVDLLEKFLKKREKDRFEYRRFVTWN